MQAAKDLGYQTIAVAGGVSANSGVRSAMAAACEKQGCKLFVPPLSLGASVTTLQLFFFTLLFSLPLGMLLAFGRMLL